MTGPYACPNVRTRYRLVPLDESTPTFMRAPGEASGVFALECAMDELAVQLGMDPNAIRRTSSQVATDASEIYCAATAAATPASIRSGCSGRGWLGRSPTWRCTTQVLCPPLA